MLRVAAFVATILALSQPARAWQARIAGSVQGQGDALAAAVTPDGDVVAAGYVPTPGQATAFTVVRLSGDDGSERWRVVLTDMARAQLAAIDPVGDVIAVGSTSSYAFTVLKLAGHTGQIGWRKDIVDTSGVTAIAVDTNGDVAAAASGGLPNGFTVLKLAGATGQQVWRTDLMGAGEALALLPNQDVVASGSLSDSSRLVVRLDGTTGNPAWQSNLAGNSYGPSFVAVSTAGDLYVADGVYPPGAMPLGRVFRLSPDTGATIWSQTMDVPNGIALHPAGIALVFTLFGFSIRFGEEPVGFGAALLGHDAGATLVQRPFQNAATGTAATGASGIAVTPSGDFVVAANINVNDSFVVTRLAEANMSDVWRREGTFTVAAPGLFTAHAVLIGRLNDLVVPGAVSAAPSLPKVFSVLDLQLADGALRACGDGVKDVGEACDDANLSEGDCCSADCQRPAPDGTTCDDGNACTFNDRCSGGVCSAEPVACEPCGRCDPGGGCYESQGPDCRHGTTTFAASLGIHERRRARTIRWDLRSGPATSRQELGEPRKTTTYALCGYDPTGFVVFRGTAPAGARCGSRACWRRTRRGFEYRDSGARDGLSEVSIEAGHAGAMHARAAGHGRRLSLPALPIEGSQLTDNAGLIFKLKRTDDDSVCWETDFSQIDVNGAHAFRARGQ